MNELSKISIRDSGFGETSPRLGGLRHVQRFAHENRVASLQEFGGLANPEGIRDLGGWEVGR